MEQAQPASWQFKINISRTYKRCGWRWVLGQLIVKVEDSQKLHMNRVFSAGLAVGRRPPVKKGTKFPKSEEGGGEEGNIYVK